MHKSLLINFIYLCSHHYEEIIDSGFKVALFAFIHPISALHEAAARNTRHVFLVREDSASILRRTQAINWYSRESH